MIERESAARGMRCLHTGFGVHLKKIARSIGWCGDKDEKGRELLQNLGVVVRTFNPDSWVSRLIDIDIPSSKGYPYDIVIIDDWRFSNEYEYIRSAGLYDIVPVFITGRGDELNMHISNIPLDKDLFKDVIEFNNSRDPLYMNEFSTYLMNLIDTKFNKGVTK